MRQVDLERPLEARALQEIERSLYNKLRAHHLSDAFIERCLGDAVQRGLVDYLHALEEGTVVENRDAFIVWAGFCRAIDELRREARYGDGTVAEAIIDGGGLSGPGIEELAIEHLQAEQLRDAVRQLPLEEQTALSLYYFKGLSAAAGARALHLSERSFRRRLQSAIGNISALLGIEVPDRDSTLAIEIGLAAWVCLRGGGVPAGQGPVEQALAALTNLRDFVSWAFGRFRDLLAGATASGSGEKVAALAGGPMGKFAGGCLGTVALCALSGVIGSGVGGVDVLTHRHLDRPPAQHRSASRFASAPSARRLDSPRVAPPSGQSGSIPGARPAPSGSTRTDRRVRISQARRQAKEQVEAQASGIARAGDDSTSPPQSSGSGTPEVTEAVTPPPSEPPGSGSTGEEAQANQQFGAFK